MAFPWSQPSNAKQGPARTDSILAGLYLEATGVAKRFRHGVAVFLLCHYVGRFAERTFSLHFRFRS